MTMHRTSLVLALLVVGAVATAAPAAPTAALTALTPQSVVSGFQARAVYVADGGRLMGAGFKHARTGLLLDVLSFESVPQVMLVVNTPVYSQRGEPHILEHLLLGKGDPGRRLMNASAMNLSDVNAATYQLFTRFDYNVVTGEEAFYRFTEECLQDFIHPGIDDEEMRREVRHLGVSSDTATSPLRLDEKGTIYDEMVNMDAQSWRVYRYMNVLLHGPEHPLAQESGGLPEALRVVTPEQLRRFHAQHYVLGNMRLIVGLAPGQKLADALARFDAMAGRVQPDGAAAPPHDEATLPPGQPAAPGTIELVDYPKDNAEEPGPAVFAWRGPEKLEPRELLLMDLFADTVGDGETSNLYKLLVDSETAKLDTGASSVWDDLERLPGHSLWFGLEGIAPERMTPERLREMGAAIQGELKRLAGLRAGAAELTDFHRRMRERLSERRRELSKMTNSPPMFGFRNWDNPVWLYELKTLDEVAGFRKELGLQPQCAYVESVLSAKTNPWGERLQRWRALDTPPYCAAARPSPDMVKALAGEKAERLDAELAGLKQRYGLADTQASLKRFGQEYDAATARLEQLRLQTPLPPLPAGLPLTYDDPLRFRVTKARGQVPVVTSTFDSTSAATVGLALSVAAVPQDQLVWLTLLPELLRGVGVVDDGKPVPYDVMQERQRREIMWLTAKFAANSYANRCELTVEASGNNAAEARRAVRWLQLVLQRPYWSAANLPRLRDVVDEALSDLRQRDQGYAENWVDEVRLGYRTQDRPVFMATGCFLTRTHLALRLRWLLKDLPAAADAKAFAVFVDELARAGERPRAELQALLTALQEEDSAKPKPAPLPTFGLLSPEGKALAREFVADLADTLADIPDASLRPDWTELCGRLRVDLMTSPAEALKALDALRRRLLATGGARLWIVGSQANQRALAGPIKELLRGLRATPPVVPAPRVPPTVVARLAAREPTTGRPVFVGLMNPSLQGSVIMNDAPAPGMRDLDAESLLRVAAGNLYAGGGAHSFYARAWNAGLAYSNGISAQPDVRRVSYYADQVPDLPHLLTLLNEELAQAPRDAALAGYALVQVFSSRAADSYEARGSAMAADLADGFTPQTVRKFREAMLALRARPQLAEELHDRVLPEYARALPSARLPLGDIPGTQYLTIGPADALAAYERYLQSVQGPQARLVRLAPRDFWVGDAPAPAPTAPKPHD